MRSSQYRIRLVWFVVLISLLAAVVPGLAVAGVATAPDAAADGSGSPNELRMLYHPSPVANDQFGDAVAISGTVALVGSSFHFGGGGLCAGRASVFEWTAADGWMFSQDLMLGPEVPFEYVGRSVAISGSTLLVGIPNRGAGAGYAPGMVLPLDKVGGNWVPGTPFAATSDVGGQMGLSVAADAQTVVCGVPSGLAGGVTSGAVLVYTRSGTGWSGPVKLEPPSPVVGMMFGLSVAVSGDDIIVGAPEASSNQGRVYTYHRSGPTWVYKGELSLFPAASDDYFGHSVAVSNGVCLVGAPGRHVSGVENVGAAYAFRYNGTSWVGFEDLTSPWLSTAAGEGFGDSVAINGDTALVHSRYGGEDATERTGAIYQYLVNPAGLTYLRAGVGTNALGNEDFGPALAFDGTTVLVGGPGVDGVLHPDDGVVWLFGLPDYRPVANSTFTVASPGVLANDQPNGAATSASLVSGPAHGQLTLSPDGSFTYKPTPGYVGADSFVYKATNSQGNADATVNLTVVAPNPKTPSSITIRTDRTSVYRYKTFVLSGLFTKGAYLDPCVVWVRKPGSARWSYSSARLCYRGNADGTANWWYRYLPKVRGKFAFKVSFPGDATRAAVYSPNIVYVTVR